MTLALTVTFWCLVGALNFLAQVMAACAANPRKRVRLSA